MSSIIVPVGKNQSHPSIGNIEHHLEYLKNNDMVFWNISPGGDKSNKITEWQHPNIKTGYFHNVVSQKIEYKFEIEYIKLIRDLNINEPLIKKWIPHWRLKYFNPTIEPSEYDENGYGILISDIIRFNPPKHKGEFHLETTKKPVKRIMKYVIVEGL